MLLTNKLSITIKLLKVIFLIYVTNYCDVNYCSKTSVQMLETRKHWLITQISSSKKKKKKSTNANRVATKIYTIIVPKLEYNCKKLENFG